MDPSAVHNDIYVRLARRSLESFIREGRKISWEEVRDELLDEEADKKAAEEGLCGRRAGAFVSIHEYGMLRGCIGTIGPVCDSLAKEIIENAISASTRDPRFDPIEAPELDKLEISVDVLGDTEDIDSEEQLDVKRYGVIVTKGYRRGLLLPNLDGVDTIAQQVSIAKQKAGLRADEEGCMLQRFEVVRHY